MKRIDYSGGAGGAPTLAEIERELADRFLRRSLMRLGFDERRLTQSALRLLERKFLPELKRMLDRELAAMESGPGIGAESMRSQELRTMLEKTDELVRGTYADLGATMAEQARTLAVREGRAAVAILQKVFPADIAFQQPSASLLRAMITKRPMGAKVLKAHVKDLGIAAKRAIEGQIRLGMMAGESVPKLKARILKDVAGKIDGPIPRQVRRQAEAIARTVPNYVGNAARAETMKANLDVLKGWRWDSTLDARSCPFCASRDGREYPPDAGAAPPPAHPQCRCQMGYVVSGEARKALGWKPLDTSKLRRAGQGGPVQYGTKFEGWLASQPDRFVDRWMGKERAALWRGGVSLDRLVDTKTMDFKPLSIARRLAVKKSA